MEIEIETTGNDFRKMVDMSTVNGLQDLLWIIHGIKDNRFLLKSETTWSNVVGNIVKYVYREGEKSSMKIKMSDNKVGLIYLSSETGLEKLNRLLNLIGSSKIKVVFDTAFNPEIGGEVAKSIKIIANRGETYILQSTFSDIYNSVSGIQYEMSLNKSGQRKDENGNVIEPAVSIKTTISDLKTAIEKYTAFSGEVPIIDMHIGKDEFKFMFGNEKDLSSPSAKIPIDCEFIKKPNTQMTISIIPMIATVLKNIEKTKVTDDITLEIYPNMVSLKSIVFDDDERIQFVRIVDLGTREPIAELIDAENEVEDANEGESEGDESEEDTL